MDKFVFHFSVDEVNKVLGALGKMPYQDVVDLINVIIKQYQDQLPQEPAGEANFKEKSKKEPVKRYPTDETKD